MIFQLTAAGAAAFQSNPSTFQVTRVVLGNGFGYVLDNPPTSIQGISVYDSTQTWAKTTSGANTLQFSRLLDNTVGNFQFGEAALYNGATIVAIGVNPTLITKTAASGSEQGNKINLTAFITNNNTSSYGFVELANSDSNLRVAQAIQIDSLTPPYEGEPNAFIVNGLTPEDTPSFAFCDNYGRWNFTTMPKKYFTGTVTGTPTSTALDIAAPHGTTFLTPTSHVLEFISGRLRGYVRRLTTINNTSFAWTTPLTVLPEAGDMFIVYGPEVNTATFSGQASIQYKEEGVNLGSTGTVTSLDFVGAGVTATRNANEITVTIPGGGGSSVFYMRLFGAANGSSDGFIFTNWTLDSNVDTSFCTAGSNGVVTFAQTGLYKVTIFYLITPTDNTWPAAFTTYGTQFGGDAYSGISERHTAKIRDNFDNGVSSIDNFTSAPDPQPVRDTDTYIIEVAATPDGFTPAAYVAQYGGSEDMTFTDLQVTIERLGNLPGY